MNHIIITKVNLHMRLDPHKYKETELWKREGWNEERIQLLNDWARASLRGQTNQNFTYVTLWQKGYMESGGELDNEIKIEIENTGTADDDPLDYKSLWEKTDGKVTLNFSGQIVRKIREKFTSGFITTLDCDDALHKDYVQVISEQKKIPYLIYDMHDRYQYNIKTGIKGVKSTVRPSPMMTCYEPDIKCIPVIYNHSVIPVPYQIRKLPALKGLQTINNTNMFVKGTGRKADFNLEDYR